MEKSLGELHIMGRKKWRVQKMGYTKMNRHNYPDIEGLTEAERAKLDHIDDIEDDLADAYDSTATYAVGDWCIRNGKLYECITAIATAEPFDSTKWRRVAVAELKSNLTENAFAIATGTFENTSGFTYIQYPTGYSMDNCTALSLEVNYYSGWRSGVGIATNSFTRLFVALNATNIGVYNSDSNLNGSDFRVVLKKIPS